MEKKKQTVKIITVAIAEIALILTTILFTMQVEPSPIYTILFGVLSMVAVVYLGLVGIGSVITERESVAVHEQVDRVMNTVTQFDDIVGEINRRNEENSAVMKQATANIAGALNLIMERIKLLDVPPETPEPPKKKR
jgi:hypothetical protein